MQNSNSTEMQPKKGCRICGMVRRYPLSTLEIVAIWVVCMVPIPETPLSGVPLMDKWTHFVMYGSLTFLIWIEHYIAERKSHHTPAPERRFPSFLGGIAFPILMGGTIELAQRYLTTCRSGEWLDFLSNSIGVLLGASLAAITILLLSRKGGK